MSEPTTTPRAEDAPTDVSDAFVKLQGIIDAIRESGGYTDLEAANEAIKVLMVTSLAVMKDREDEFKALKEAADGLHGRLLAMENNTGAAAAQLARDTLEELSETVIEHGNAGEQPYDTAMKARQMLAASKPALDAHMGRRLAYQGIGVPTIAAHLNHEAADSGLRRLGAATADRMRSLLETASGALGMLDADMRNLFADNNRLHAQLHTLREEAAQRARATASTVALTGGTRDAMRGVDRECMTE